MRSSAGEINDMILAQYAGVWAREGDMFLNAGTGRRTVGDQWLELRNVNLYQFDAEGRLSSIARAASPSTARAAGCCAMSCVRASRRPRCRKNASRSNWKTQLDDAALAASVPPAYLPSRLNSRRAFRTSAQRPGCRGVRGDLLGALVLSAERAGAVPAAVRFAFGSLRSGGLGKRLFIGIVFALGFWMLQTMFGNSRRPTASTSASRTCCRWR